MPRNSTSPGWATVIIGLQGISLCFWNCSRLPKNAFLGRGDREFFSEFYCCENLAAPCRLSVLESCNQHLADWLIVSAFTLASWILTLLRLNERSLLVKIILVSINLSGWNLCFLFLGWTMGWQLVNLLWYEPFSRYYSENCFDECWGKKNCVFFFSCRYLYNVSWEK